MRENSVFKVGDKAINTLVGVKVEVQFGPVMSQMGKTAYLVKDQGQSYLLWEEDMKPVPRFEVGQVVRTSGILCKVIAGPFAKSPDYRFYVLEDPDGSQDIESEVYMVPVVE